MRGRYRGEMTCSLCGHRGCYKDFTRFDYDGDRICILCQIQLDKERNAHQRSLPYYLKDVDSQLAGTFEAIMRRRKTASWDSNKAHNIPEWRLCKTQSTWVGEVLTEWAGGIEEDGMCQDQSGGY